MTMNETMLNGKWTEIKGDLRKAWGKLTDDELEKTKGDMTAITGVLQQRYGETKEVYSSKVSDIFKRFELKKDEAVAGVKQALKN